MSTITETKPHDPLLDELIRKAGDRLQTQPLNRCFISYKKVKHGAEVTFGTTEEAGNDLARQAMIGTANRKFIGIVVWLPADVVDSARATANEGAS